MATPALAKPVRVLIAIEPGAVKEKTNNSLSPVATGNAAAAVPVAVSPTATTGPKAGAKFTATPVGVKVLLAAGAIHNSALTVPAAPKVTPTVALKNADMDVIVPARGTTNAKSGMFVAPTPRVSVPALRLTVGAELPNPTIAPVPTNPPATVASATGVVPDAYGMIAPAPGVPAGPGPCTVTACALVQPHLTLGLWLSLQFSFQCSDKVFHLF
jgi:hypothetical protein